jgi:deoxyribodipyrimidine photo-lyase
MTLREDPGGVPALRVRPANDKLPSEGRDYILYWMIAARRTNFNYAFDRAVAWAKQLDKPLVVLEPLRVDYPWASDRFHRFVIDGMRDNRAALERTNVTYYPYVEPKKGVGKGLLAALARRACVVVTDNFPCFFLPHMVKAAAQHLDVLLEEVDSNGVMPLGATPRDYPAASHFRRHLQAHLPKHLPYFPSAHPLEKARLTRLEALPPEVTERWRPAESALLEGDPAALAALPIDHQVTVSPVFKGGARAAQARATKFVTELLPSYPELRNEPAHDGTSKLSPYLHFGHISPHQVLAMIMERERWNPEKLTHKPTGAREGWWGMSAAAEAYLDQLLVWRELGYNTCQHRPDDFDRYESLPEWAQATLAEHARDPRPRRYTLEEFEACRTHDPVWNAAMGQMKTEGWYHNYARMLWGKKILEWSESPREALRIMIQLMNRWSLDGRNPNSYTGYFWTLGRYDRPWPERPVFGKVRAMSTERAAEKLELEPYIDRFSPDAADS